VAALEARALFHLDCWIIFDVFLTVATVIGNSARDKIDIVAHNAGPPTGSEKLGKRTFPRLVAA